MQRVERGDSYDESQSSGSHTIPISDMLDILKLISRVEPIELLLDRIAHIITSSFGVKALVICTLDEQTGLFTPRCVRGFPEDNTAAIRKHTYSVDRKRKDVLDEFRIGQRTYMVRSENSGSMTNEDMDYIIRVDAMSEQRKSPEHWHELDYAVFMMVDRLGNWIGWIEIDYTSDGRILARDATHRIQLLADLVGIAIENSKMYEDAISAMNESQGYLDLIVHDIGNMINPLMYYLDKIEKSGTMDATNGDSLEKALAVSKAAKGLVDNVRKMSEAKSSQYSEKDRYDLRDVLVKCMSTLKREFPSRDIVLSFDCPEGECTIEADELIHDLFMNILSNAVKYNPKPTAEIEVSIHNGAGVWTVAIEDHGMGIADDRKSMIFNRFAKRPEGVSGTGMGLSIVSLLVERYSGVVGVTDRVAGDHSEGARFEISLPKINGSETVRQMNGVGAFGSSTSSPDWS